MCTGDVCTWHDDIPCFQMYTCKHAMFICKQPDPNVMTWQPSSASESTTYVWHIWNVHASVHEHVCHTIGSALSHEHWLYVLWCCAASECTTKRALFGDHVLSHSVDVASGWREYEIRENQTCFVVEVDSVSLFVVSWWLSWLSCMRDLYTKSPRNFT